MILSTIAAAFNRHRGSYTSPALAAASHPFCGLAAREPLALQAVPVQQV